MLRANPFAASRQATVLQVEPEPPLPRLERTFPRGQLGVSPRWGISMGLGLNHVDPGEKRTHRIADGDTLPDLAQRYLGDKTRALEIFEANRHILPSPEILPIGQEITIPGAVRPASASSESESPEQAADADSTGRPHTRPKVPDAAPSASGAAAGLAGPPQAAATAAP